MNENAYFSIKENLDHIETI